MVYRKISARKLFTGHDMLDHQAVLILRPDGRVEEILHESEAGENIQRLEGILIPGLINCHGHLELSHLKGLIPEGTGLVDFVLRVVQQRHFPEEEILEGIRSGEEEMIQNGIVAAGDICNNILSISQKKKNKLRYYNFIETSGWNPQVATVRFERSKAIYDAFCQLGPEQYQSLVPHAPYSVSEDLWNLIAPYFPGRTITMHNQETEWEDELFIHGRGEALRMYEEMKIANNSFQPTGRSSLQMVESVAGQSGVFWCLCPNANRYIEKERPPVQLLRKNRGNIVLGTDSLASNHSLSILEEIKTIREYEPGIPDAEILKWATLNGARALDMDDQLGSFEPGRKPGVVLIENLEEGRISRKSFLSKII
jgi:cytosine/adenosine deaminase-related metal-dependent hydrolase